MYQTQQMGRIRALSLNAQVTLDELDSTFETLLADKDLLQAVNLKPGDALIVNNGVGKNAIQGALHGRLGAIHNKRRWIQRGLAERVAQ